MSLNLPTDWDSKRTPFENMLWRKLASSILTYNGINRDEKVRERINELINEGFMTEDKGQKIREAVKNSKKERSW